MLWRKILLASSGQKIKFMQGTGGHKCNAEGIRTEAVNKQVGAVVIIPGSNLIIHQRGVHYIGIKIFNNLSPYIKDISNNVKKFEICLKQFLHIHSFYSLEECFQHKSITS
jgi:hypothetical protein